MFIFFIGLLGAVVWSKEYQKKKKKTRNEQFCQIGGKFKHSIILVSKSRRESILSNSLDHEKMSVFFCFLEMTLMTVGSKNVNDKYLLTSQAC